MKLLFILLFVVFDIVVVVLLVAMLCRKAWSPIQKTWQARPAADDAVRRSFQTFKIGIMNLGLAVHVAADEAYLHLTPIAAMRCLGLESVSIPWDAISDIKPTRFSRGRYRDAKIGATTIMGPAWCMDLATDAISAVDDDATMPE